MAKFFFEYKGKRSSDGRPNRKRRKRLSASKKWWAKYDAYIKSSEWQAFRLKVFAARGKRCEQCGADRPPIHLHHLHYKTFKKERMEDVQILCEACHRRIPTKRFIGWFTQSL